MKTPLVTFLRRTPYALSAAVALLTLIAVGCQPSATYQGERVTAPELEAAYEADIRALELKADALGATYEQQVATLTATYEQQMDGVEAEATAITDAAEIAGATIERKGAFVSQAVTLGKNVLLTIASGGTINTGETLASGLGLAGLLGGLGGFGTAVSALRKKKLSDENAAANEDALVDVVTSIDRVKDSEGNVNFKDATVRARLEANQSTGTRRKVKVIRDAA